MRRRKSREIALQTLFALENQPGGIEAMDPTGASGVVTSYLKNFGPRNSEEAADVPYLLRLLTGVLHGLKEIDAELEKHSEHWKLYRMTKIDRNILRIGAAELKSFSDIPPKVTLDECVELAKRFGTDDSSSFVNGILDRVKTALGRQDS
ncbi:MAG: transcription antitermination factor NusB [Proteobacteria bacterium]|nr:MAG: transcription antitermination factor NusB [Pseudomonadota bacterium]